MVKLDLRDPPGPFRPTFWRSPLRGPWLTAVLGSVLLVGVTVLFVTGLLSYAAYNPDLPGNDTTPGKGALGFFLFDWPTRPIWLYRLTQGVHVTLGLVLIPVLLAKLWSVIPKLFVFPPVRSPAHLLERASLLLLVGGAVFEFVTGVLNVQYWYAFPGSFYRLHFYGAWVFMAAFAVHVSLRLRRMWTALRSRRLREVLGTPASRTRPEPADPDGLVSPRPASPTMSRRGALGLVGGGSLAVLAMTVGQSVGGPLRRTALLAPRGREPGTGPAGFQVNKTADAAGIGPALTGAGWRLTVLGAGPARALSRADLLAMPQHTARLPIACVEGWSTADQSWTGVRLRDLARLSRHPRSRIRLRRVAAAARRVPLGVPAAQPDPRRRQPARPAGQRRRPVAGPRLPGAGHRPGQPGRPQHQVGVAADLPRCGMSGFRRRYGAGPLHLVAMVAGFAVAGYAAVQLLSVRPLSVAGWLVGAAVGHDLILLPLYGVADALLVRRYRSHPRPAGELVWVNYVRVPAVLSLLLLVVFGPSVLRLSESYPRATALSSAHYARDWLLVTAAVFLASALLLALRLRRSHRPAARHD